ncbi:metallophosphoesterase [Muricoccus aerilatus]|uniref:metallophosphoesterase n=1 Tax=Muricoccus aerilatus TaxID=452982 RepID=UPI0005C24212|nr:metallophosphoesterase [Roseomonas aerilata]
MEPLTRRRFLTASLGGVAVLASAGAVAAYAVVLEPGYRLIVQEYRLSLPGWGERPPMTLCLLADPHCCEPWMPLSRLQGIVRLANSLQPDIQIVLGDLPAHHRFVSKRLPMTEVAAILAELDAPLGRFAVLGNHDWWDDLEVQRSGTGRPAIEGHLNRAGVPVLANAATLLPHGRDGIWLCGTDSMWAFRRRQGADDLRGTLAQISTDAPAILLAHEPDIFPSVPARISLTLSGHTHGGQVRVNGYSPMVPSAYGNRYAYGLVVEQARNLIVSGGLGCSMMPVRLGVPPELTLVHLA